MGFSLLPSDNVLQSSAPGANGTGSQNMIDPGESELNAEASIMIAMPPKFKERVSEGVVVSGSDMPPSVAAAATIYLEGLEEHQTKDDSSQLRDHDSTTEAKMPTGDMTPLLAAANSGSRGHHHGGQHSSVAPDNGYGPIKPRINIEVWT